MCRATDCRTPVTAPSRVREVHARRLGRRSLRYAAPVSWGAASRDPRRGGGRGDSRLSDSLPERWLRRWRCSRRDARRDELSAAAAPDGARRGTYESEAAWHTRERRRHGTRFVDAPSTVYPPLPPPRGLFVWASHLFYMHRQKRSHSFPWRWLSCVSPSFPKLAFFYSFPSGVFQLPRQLTRLMSLG